MAQLRVEESLWVSREGVVEENGGDTVHSVEGKGGLPPTAQQPRNLATELFNRSFCFTILEGKGDITEVFEHYSG